jgi:glutamate/tyrosine decarboxylase-like PLP-dependent enzyme
LDYDARTDQVIEEILAVGEAFFGGVTWRGRRCMRVSVSSWQTTDRDVERTIDAVGRAIQAAAQKARASSSERAVVAR